MADLLARPMSVCFNTKSLNRIKHEDVLCALREQVDIQLDTIKAIQITEKKCIITVSEENTKHDILLAGLSLHGQHVSVSDVDNIFTNVTIKDAPFEMTDSVIISQMSQFGEVVSGSLVRGKIKNTEIENGTRYVKLMNCVPILPLTVTIGRFKVRLFADNNRTACKYCSETSHPYFKCPNKAAGFSQSTENRSTLYSDAVKAKVCFNCKGEDHVRNNCPRDIVCHGCLKEGHYKKDCPIELYGQYAGEILEGRQSDNDVTPGQTQSSTVSASVEPQSDVTISNESPKQLPSPSGKSKVQLILGDSNCKRLLITDKSVKNISLSGQKLSSIDTLISKVKIRESETVNSVIIHLGTNDLSSDSVEQITENVKVAFSKANNNWPNTPVAFSSIIPRRGTNQYIKDINEKAKAVNRAVSEICKSNKNCHFLNNDLIFLAEGKFQKHLFDSSESSGVHISDDGALELYNSFQAFFFEGESDELVTGMFDAMTPFSRKRERGSSSNTPPSVDRKVKQAKNTKL